MIISHFVLFLPLTICHYFKTVTILPKDSHIEKYSIMKVNRVYRCSTFLYTQVFFWLSKIIPRTFRSVLPQKKYGVSKNPEVENHLLLITLLITGSANSFPVKISKAPRCKHEFLSAQKTQVKHKPISVGML